MTQSSNEPSALAAYEQMYLNEPDRYRSRVKRWMLMGYGYVIGVIAFVVLFVVGGIYLFASGHLYLSLADNFLRIGLPALAAAGLMARGFFVQVPPPAGTRLTGALDAASVEFFEDIRKRCGGPKIHSVVLDTQLNLLRYKTLLTH